jgi:hypothetical protein
MVLHHIFVVGRVAAAPISRRRSAGRFKFFCYCFHYHIHIILPLPIDKFEISQAEITHDDHHKDTSTNRKTAGTPPSSSEHQCHLLLAGMHVIVIPR